MSADFQALKPKAISLSTEAQRWSTAMQTKLKSAGQDKPLRLPLCSDIVTTLITPCSYTHILLHRQHVYMYVYYVWVLDGCVLT